MLFFCVAMIKVEADEGPGQDDFFFSSEVRPGTEYSVYGTKSKIIFDQLIFRLNYNKTAFENYVINSIDILPNSNEGSLSQTKYYSEDFTLSTDASLYYIDIAVDLSDYNEEIGLKATINYGEDNFTLETTSISVSMMTCWKLMRDAGTLQEHYSKIENEDTAEDAYNEVLELLESDENGFSLKAKSAVYSNMFTYSYNIVTGAPITYQPDINKSNAIYRVSLMTVPNQKGGTISFYYENAGFSFSLNEEGFLGYSDTYGISGDAFLFWREGEYFYFTFNFLDKIEEAPSLITSFNTVIDIAANPDDNEYIQSLISQIDEWKKRYEDETSKNIANDETLKKLYEEKAKLEADISLLNSDLTTLQEEKARLETLIIEKEELIKKFEEEVDRLQIAYDSTTANNLKLNSDLEIARAELATLKEEKAALETALEGDNAELISLLRSREAEITRLNNEIKKLQDENENLKQQIKAQGNFVGCGSIDTRNGAGGSGAFSA